MDQMEALREQMLRTFVKSNKGRLSSGRDASFYDVMMGFIHAVDWREVRLAGAQLRARVLV